MILDTRGKVCPFPLVEAKEAIKDVKDGAALTIYFDCTQATETIPEWAAKEGHEVLEFKRLDDAEWLITIKPR